MPESKITRSDFVKSGCVAGFVVSTVLQLIFFVSGSSPALQIAYSVMWPSAFLLMGIDRISFAAVLWLVVAIILNVVMYGLLGLVLFWIYRLVVGRPDADTNQ
jgi:hypothetical protein